MDTDAPIGEFYGILANHYIKAENLDKAEVFMLKAGEEALKASASSEAIEYYKEGLKLYQEKYGESVDPEMVALMNKNIAFALFNKGRNLEALEYFDKLTTYYGFNISKHASIAKIKSGM